MHRCHLLKSLNLQGCKGISDAGVSQLANSCTILEWINLAECDKLTDASIQSLSQSCTLLKYLNISKLPLTDISVMYIGNYAKNLQTLIMKKCAGIQDDSVAFLAKSSLNSLLVLDLDGCTNVSDSSIQQLCLYCTQLQILDISFCRKITFPSILLIVNMLNNLTDLRIWGHSVSEKQMMELRALNRHLNIYCTL